MEEQWVYLNSNPDSAIYLPYLTSPEFLQLKSETKY